MDPLTDQALLARIEACRKCLRRLVGHDDRRDLSIVLRDVLASTDCQAKAALLAQLVTGTEPAPWLRSSEAMEELERLGIRKSLRSLQRLAVKARKGASGRLKVWMNRQGNWDGPASTKLKDPIAVVTVNSSTAHARFLVEPLSPFSGNGDTSSF